jgi:hypothetical protein
MIGRIRFLTLLTLSLVIMLTPFFVVQAAGPSVWGPLEQPLPGMGNVTIDDFVNQKNPLLTYIGSIANFFLAAIVAVALMVITVAGYFYMTAGGNGKQVETAKEMVKAALTGLAVALLAYILLAMVGPQFVPKQDPDLTGGSGFTTSPR